MKQRKHVHVAAAILLVIAGTVVLLISVSSGHALISGRTKTAEAYVAQTQPELIQRSAASPATPATTIPTQAGELIRQRAIQEANRGGFEDLAMRVAGTAPLITQQAAQQVALDTGYSYAQSLVFEDRPLTVTAFYGRLTYGAPADTSEMRARDGVSAVTGACQDWAGPCDVPVKTCKAGVCQDTGKTIDRIKDRPYWILDYGGFEWERQACAGCPRQVYNHAVIVVDAQDRFVLMSYGYTAP